MRVPYAPHHGPCLDSILLWRPGLRALAAPATTSAACGMFIIPYGAPEGYEWLVALMVLVGLYFAIGSFMRARR